MRKGQFVKDLPAKTEVNDLFMVKFIAVMEARDGRSYLNMVLSDKTGDLEARAWTGAEEIASRIEKGHFVQAAGRMNQFQGRNQLIISSVEGVSEDEVDREDYVKKSEFSSDKMYDSLIKIVEALDEVYIRDLLLMILNDQEIAPKLKLWPAGKTIHHAYESGLLEHILSCTELAVSLSEHYKVNKSYVVAGCILHDLCKIYELSDPLNTEYTEEGKLVGHLSQGSELIDKFTARIKHFPYHMRLHLKHILLAHHGSLEFGSPKLPQTKEAYLVHLIDFMDSKMSSMDSAIASDKTPGKWTGFVKHMDRIIYKEPLPSFKDYREAPEKEEGNESTRPKTPKKSKGPSKVDPKQNLGELLKDFKVKS